jgi:hypothetical protein
VDRYKTFFDEIIDLDTLSPEAKKIYATVKRWYNKNINEEPETDNTARFYHVEWLLLQDVYFGELRRLRESLGGKSLDRADATNLHKLYDDLEIRFCLKKQEQRAEKKT